MKFLREPLTQFVLLGAALFGIFSLVGKLNIEKPAQITITPAKIDELVKGYKLDFKKSPTPAEVDHLIDDYIREEVLCREAWAEQLDRDDRVIRARLRQKMEFLNDSAEDPVPTDAQLQAYLDANPKIFAQPDGHVPQLSQVRDSVQSSWIAAQQKQTRDAAYRKLLAKYTVVVERPAPTAQPATEPTRTAEAR
jgi:hypothetical protein